jgi:hypothetical protein
MASKNTRASNSAPDETTLAEMAEDARLNAANAGAEDWRRWGTYLSERAWGTVREDYSANGDAWNYFPFDQARSRAYRWNEDGLAGWCDRDQTICLGLGLWNGKDAILKERPFGLTNLQGNHGEDVKDYWFYTDNTPTHAYAAMIYKYPQAAYPYEDLRNVNARRGQNEPEYELFDALHDMWIENRYFDALVEYAKVDPEDVLCRITVTNRGPDAAAIHVLPHLWYRNTWSWTPDAERPRITRTGDGAASTEHPALGQRYFHARTATGLAGDLLFCENETNDQLLFGAANTSPYVKDGVNDFVVHGDEGAANREAGSKMAAHFTTTIEPGQSWVIQTRFSPSDLPEPFANFDALFSQRRAEADAFYAARQPHTLTPDQRWAQRQALAGLLWCKQYYHYRVYDWLTGDPTQPTPPAERWNGRNSDWLHILNSHVILMPDAWEYPWYASWDLAFHCVTIALIDPEFAKQQLRLITSYTYQHPYGQIPAYEWNFDDTNPPVSVWAAWQVYLLDFAATGKADRRFLQTIFRSMQLVVSWWLNKKDETGRGVFGGGFLGMDNIGVFDRDEALPTGGFLAEVDGTSWVAATVLHMTEIAVELAREDPTFEDLLARYVLDFVSIATVLEQGIGGKSFWNEDDGFYHDVIMMPNSEINQLRVFSLQGLTPLFAAIAVPHKQLGSHQHTRVDVETFLAKHPILRDAFRSRQEQGAGHDALYGVVYGERLRRILRRMLDPDEFLSPHGIRSLSRVRLDDPYELRVRDQVLTVKYEPAESSTGMFGGNSNWRGPIWFPMNFMIIQALTTYAQFYGETMSVEYPTGSGKMVGLQAVADDLAARLTSIFLRDEDGRRPVFGGNDYFQTDPHWRDLIPFHEYFHGDNGAGLGASHQTGWTALAAVLLQYGGKLRFERPKG